MFYINCKATLGKFQTNTLNLTSSGRRNAFTRTRSRSPIWPSCKRSAYSTHIHTQVFYGSLDFVQDNPGELVPEETFTHSHLSWSSVVPYMLHPSNTIQGILSVQFTCLTVFFHNLCPSFLWSTSWSGTLHFILHTFLHPIIVFFLQHVPAQPTVMRYTLNNCHVK